MMSYDVVIIGGGPAGLSAALVLGRARKRVLLVDRGVARNAASERIYGFVTRDGTTAVEFRDIARKQLERYPSVAFEDARASHIAGNVENFEVQFEQGGSTSARRVLLCVGIVDEMLDLPGYRQLWGKAVFGCPYCHGWEVQDRPLGYLATTSESPTFSLLLKAWSNQVTLFTNGVCELSEPASAELQVAGVSIENARLDAMVIEPGDPERLSGLRLASGAIVECQGLFVEPQQHQVNLVERLGLRLERGTVWVDEHLLTSRPGISAAGDLATHTHGAVAAAAAGSAAAHAINESLMAPQR